MILCFLADDGEVMEETPNKVKMKLDLPSGLVSHLETWSIDCFLYYA